MTQEETSRRRAALIASMHTRLRPLCAEWPEPAFQEMVERLADITLRYEGVLPLGSSYDRRTTDRLIAEMRHLLERSESEQKDTAQDDIPRD
jgi:hypothetical protein